MITNYVGLDKIFSYWIFIWVFIYIVAEQYQNNSIGNFIYDNTNPTYMLYLAFLDNIIIILILLYYNPKLKIIIKYLFLIVLIKMIPLAYLDSRVVCIGYSNNYAHKQSSWLHCSPELLKNTKINIKNNILFSLIFFLIFNFYLLFYGTNFLDIHQRIIQSLILDDKNTPFNYFLSTYVSKNL